MINNVDPTKGYECWRKLAQHYDPTGGESELDRHLLSAPRCKSLNSIISTIGSWEHNWALYMDRTKEALPERWRVKLLLRMEPKDIEQDIRLRYVQNIKTVTYAQLREQVFADCTFNSKGLSGMHLG